LEHLLEPLIERFLCLGGSVFVAPQFQVDYVKATNDGGACPDFLALDLERSELVVVEVNGGSDIKNFAERVEQRETRWFTPIKRRFIETKILGSSWNVRFLGIVRGNNPNNVQKLETKFAKDGDVTFFPLERAILAHEYWDTRITGLPRGRSV
jgi:hypothetical protein